MVHILTIALYALAHIETPLVFSQRPRILAFALGITAEFHPPLIFLPLSPLSPVREISPAEGRLNLP